MAITLPASATLPMASASPRVPSFNTSAAKTAFSFEVYKKAVRSFPRYLDAPAEVHAKGFFEVLRYWLASTDHLIREDWIPYRVSLLGNYGTDLALKREINRFLLAEDPYGTVAFVRFGLQRKELRNDMDQEMIVSILDWTMERFQDALLTEELDPGLFRRQGNVVEKKDARIRNFWMSCGGRSAPKKLHNLAIRNMNVSSLHQILSSYDDQARPRRRAHHSRALVRRSANRRTRIKTVFSNSWQMVGRADQVEKPGQFVTFTVAGEPIVVVRGNDGVLARLLQCLPSSCRGGCHRALRAGLHPALPLSRLELRTRRLAQRDA